MSHYFINMPEDRGKKYEQFTYPAGETQVRLLPNQLEEVEKSSGLVITARITDGNSFPMSLLLNAIQEIGCFHEGINVILPYMPYSRADRRFTKGDCFALQSFCETLMHLYTNRIVTFDVHSTITSSELPRTGFINVSSMQIIRQVLNHLTERPTILLPDEGSRYRYDWSTFSGNFSVAHCSKHRDEATGRLNNFEVPNITTPTALIVDDICDGGATFIGIAKKLKEQQDIKLYLYVSHGIFSKGFDELRKYFEHIYTTDSLYGSNWRSYTQYPYADFVTFFPIEGLLKASFLSTSELFKQVEEK